MHASSSKSPACGQPSFKTTTPVPHAGSSAASTSSFANTPQGPTPAPQVTSGEVWDVAVDLRRSSPTFKQWFGTRLSVENKRMMWVPPGFGHGFVVLSDFADFLYKTTEFYDQPSDRAIQWNDPDIGIQWPLEELPTSPVLAPSKDQAAATVGQCRNLPLTPLQITIYQ